MSAIEKPEPQLTNPASITAISANSRIVYILRFSKQAILIVDQDEELSSQVSRQYLGSLSENHNAAYVAISPKHNDIQVRCRIVEQLFSNTLFDPEQSLAVSIINLVKEQNKYTSIVIENMQNASLQIMHELAQVALIAKKSNLNINVVMAGSNAAACLAADNATLFSNNLSLLGASSGQLLPLNAKLFRSANSKKLSAKSRRLAWLLLIGATLISATLYGLNSTKLFQFSQLPSLIGGASQPAPTINDQQTVLPMQNQAPQQTTTGDDNMQKVNTNKNIASKPITIASAADILLSLQQPNNSFEPKKNELTASQPSDVLAALGELSSSNDEQPEAVPSIENDAPTTSTNTTNQKTAASTTVSSSTQSQPATTAASSISFSSLSSSYYQNVQGFVVQFSGFTQQQALDEYLMANRQLSFNGYYRLLNNKQMLVLTSEIFATAQQASAFLQNLPNEIQQSGAFVKSTQAINNEISAFQGSQSL